MFISASISDRSDNSDGRSSSGPPSGHTFLFLVLFLLFVNIINRIQGQEDATSTEAVTTTAISTGVRPCSISLSFSVYVVEVVGLHSKKEITLNRFSLCKSNLYNKELTNLFSTLNLALLCSTRHFTSKTIFRNNHIFLLHGNFNHHNF